MTKNALLPLTIAAMFALAGCASGGAEAGDPSVPADGKSGATASATASPSATAVDNEKPAKGASLMPGRWRTSPRKSPGTTATRRSSTKMPCGRSFRWPSRA